MPNLSRRPTVQTLRTERERTLQQQRTQLAGPTPRQVCVCVVAAFLLSTLAALDLPSLCLVLLLLDGNARAEHSPLAVAATQERIKQCALPIRESERAKERDQRCVFSHEVDLAVDCFVDDATQGKTG